MQKWLYRAVIWTVHSTKMARRYLGSNLINNNMCCEQVTCDKSPARLQGFTRISSLSVSSDQSEDSITSNGDSHQHPVSNQSSHFKLCSPSEHYSMQKMPIKCECLFNIQTAQSTTYSVTPRFCNIMIHLPVLKWELHLVPIVKLIILAIFQHGKSCLSSKCSS